MRCQAGEHWSACGRSLIYSGCRSPSLSPPLHTHTQSHMRSSVGLSLTHSLFPSCHFNISSSPSYSLPSLSFFLSISLSTSPPPRPQCRHGQHQPADHHVYAAGTRPEGVRQCSPGTRGTVPLFLFIPSLLFSPAVVFVCTVSSV